MVNMDSASTDPELHDWLVLAEEHGSNFIRALAEAALVADLKHYTLLRPGLLKVKEDETRHTTSSTALDCETDEQLVARQFH